MDTVECMEGGPDTDGIAASERGGAHLNNGCPGGGPARFVDENLPAPGRRSWRGFQRVKCAP